MTTAAVAGELPPFNSLPFGGGLKVPAAVTKRKTPSELRGELLKRRNFVELVDESSGPVTSSTKNADEAVSGPKKSDSSKAPRYIDTQIPYLVTKSIRHRLLSKKDNPKQESVTSESIGGIKNSGVPMNLYAKSQVHNSCLEDTVASESCNDYSHQATNATTHRNNVTFASLRGLFVDYEKLNGSDVDMDKAFKGILSYQPEPVDTLDRIVPQNFSSEFLLDGQEIPLDLTLKTTMRFQSSSSVNWFHRFINCGTLNGYVCSQSQSTTRSVESTPASQINNPVNFHSWVHPQSTLPRSAVSALIAAGGQTDFLTKRQEAWEDSFQSLYYMLRKKICKLFYVCTEQFIVLFTCSDCSNKTKRSFYAYVSQSTRNLRSILKEHDVSFSMPLCHFKVEEATAEDLVELSEMAKHNLGQTRAVETTADVDNSPQSLLMFSGSKNVQGLYDFLFNYRAFLTSLTGDDVPVLYSPVPFENAALSAPEIRCREVRRADHTSTNDNQPDKGATSGISYSIEVRDAYLPPWIISDICNAMRCKGGEFQASFKTKQTSIGLNIGLSIDRDQPGQGIMADKPLQADGSFGIVNATLSRHLHSAYLEGLKYTGVSYTASLSRIT